MATLAIPAPLPSQLSTATADNTIEPVTAPGHCNRIWVHNNGAVDLEVSRDSALARVNTLPPGADRVFNVAKSTDATPTKLWVRTAGGASTCEFDAWTER